jgi:hypothetical protein
VTGIDAAGPELKLQKYMQKKIKKIFNILKKLLKK